MNSLSKLTLEELEAEIESLLNDANSNLLAASRIVSNIYRDKLYEKDYGTFDNYLLKRWKWKKSRGYQMIQAALVIEALPKGVSTMVENERQVRELAKAPPEQREKIVKAIVKSGEPVTAKTINGAVHKLAEKAEKKVYPERRLDRVGRKIPYGVIELWDRAEAASVYSVDLSAKLKTFFKKAMEESDPVFGRTSANELFGILQKVKWACKDLRPYAVCTECQGMTKKQCTFCHGRGYISLYNWGQVPEEKRAVIAKAAAQAK